MKLWIKSDNNDDIDDHDHDYEHDDNDIDDDMQDDAENLPMGKPVVILRAEGMFGIKKLCCHLFVKILMISNQIVVDIHNQIVVDIHVALHVEKKMTKTWNVSGIQDVRAI